MASTAGAKTILVVDDEPEVRGSTALLLETLGYAVLEAGDGRSAITMLEQGTVVHVLLADVILPGEMTGAELAERVRAEWPGLGVLLTSGRPEFLEGRPFEVIGKPFRLAELGQKIEAVLDAGG